MSFEQSYSDADQRFHMQLIFEDSARVKGEPLNDKEKLFYRAAALGVTIQEVAQSLYWTIGSARAFVSDKISQYIKGLLTQKNCVVLQGMKRIFWHQIPGIFQRLGYERLSGSDDKRLLVEISKGESVPEIQHLAQEVTEAMYRIRFEGWQPNLPQSLIQPIQASLKKAYEAKDRREAIRLNHVLVTSDPLGQMSALVKIAEDLVLIDRYCDALPLAFQFLSFLESQEDRANLYWVIASSFYEMAYQTIEEHYRVQAVGHYQQFITYGTSRDGLALYNIFYLNFDFAVKTQKYNYLLMARLSLEDFIKACQAGKVKIDDYKESIQSSVTKNAQETQDPILHKNFKIILGW